MPSDSNQEDKISESARAGGSVDSESPGSADGVARRERARWRSRRGLLELELLLGPFVDGGFDQLPESGKSEYERLLDYDDLDAHEWLLGRAEPPMEVTGIVAEIRRFLELD